MSVFGSCYTKEAFTKLMRKSMKDKYKNLRTKVLNKYVCDPTVVLREEKCTTIYT